MNLKTGDLWLINPPNISHELGFRQTMAYKFSKGKPWTWV